MHVFLFLMFFLFFYVLENRHISRGRSGKSQTGLTDILYLKLILVIQNQQDHHHL